jgi:hypothetical protein
MLGAKVLESLSYDEGKLKIFTLCQVVLSLQGETVDFSKQESARSSKDGDEQPQHRVKA